MNYLNRLREAYPPGEARAIYLLVMEKRFGLSATQVLLGKDKELSALHHAELGNIIERLLQREPVQYILGEADFCGHTFHVEPGVLIPRPETEELVRLIARQHQHPVRTLDIGTGSGCIAISLALMGHHVSAMDISADALRIAGENANRLGTVVEWIEADILQSPQTEGKWDVIVSNPPYICRSEAAEMEQHVLEHEPHLALFVPDNDPLLFYRAITEWSTQHLQAGGTLYFEVNRAYAHDVASLMSGFGFRNIITVPDQFGNPRIVYGKLPS